jgi:nucleotide-binding universal stress UspA family protein
VSGQQNVTSLEAPLRIVVPVDGSAPANRAVAHALSLVAGRPESEIVLINAQNLQSLDISDIFRSHDGRGRSAARGTAVPDRPRRAITLCRKAQARFVARAELGSPAETIDRVAREVGAYQIVMGTRGLGSLGNLFLGSVATKVVRLAQVPVTWVK